MSEVVTVALITGLSTGLPGLVAALAAHKRAAMAERHVRPNGEGTIVEMQERTLLSLGRIEERLAEHIDDVYAHGGR